MSTVSRLPSTGNVRWWRRFHVRLAFLNGLIMLGTVGGLGAVFYQLTLDSELDGLRGRLRATVATMARHIDGNAIAALPPQGAPEAELVAALKVRFAKVVATDPDVTSIYLLRIAEEPDALRFVADFTTHSRTGQPGERYDASGVPKLRQGLVEVTVEERVWRDAFGLTLSGYAPVKLAGQPFAVLGVDVDAARISAIEAAALGTTLLFVAIALALLALLSAVIGRRIRRPLAQIHEAAERIADGDFTLDVDVDRQDEFGMVASHFARIAKRMEERDFIRDAFGRYVSPDVARRILSDRSASALGGEERDATVLFSDIAGYSAVNEQVPAREMIAVLNSYLSAMTEIIDRHSGCVIEFLGDAILCVFNTPNDVHSHAETAARCALQMRTALHALNTTWATTPVAAIWRQSGYAELRMRIGIHTGTLIAGNIGSPTRMKYGVLGDVVNVAARLEAMNKRLDTSILMSQEVFARLPDDLQKQAWPCGTQAVRGRQDGVEVWAL